MRRSDGITAVLIMGQHSDCSMGSRYRAEPILGHDQIYDVELRCPIFANCTSKPKYGKPTNADHLRLLLGNFTFFG